MSHRVFAYYLPQYHPIKENDEWWGKGFTEWTNVTKAKPLFKGHNQPRFPADLGYYDLRVPEVREQQAEMARMHGIEGFVYYHYWFGNGRKLLERPIQEVLKSGKPDYPFMLCWANEDWKGIWHGLSKGKVLIKQEYHGETDILEHFNYVLPLFHDKRYVKIDGKPVFHVYKPIGIPDLLTFTEMWNKAALKAGLKGIYFLATNVPIDWNPKSFGFDGVVSNNFHDFRSNFRNSFFNNKLSLFNRFERRIRNKFNNLDPEQRSSPIQFEYSKIIELISDWPNVEHDYYPLIVPDWDNSARAGNKSLIIKGSTPELWSILVKKSIDYSERYETSKQIIFVKSWNEWAEGNYLEPDQKWGMAYLEELKKNLEEYQ